MSKINYNLIYGGIHYIKEFKINIYNTAIICAANVLNHY